MTDPKDILIQILKEAKERGVSIGVTQLVKFLYLTEVESYRLSQERLTHLRWVFYHYGPYALELKDVLSEPEFVKEEFKTRDERDFVRYRVAEQVLPYNWKIETRLSLIIKQIIGRWKDEPLENLLDYVYFDTEPMQTVKRRGDELDFTTIRPQTENPEAVPLKASKEAEKKLKQIWERMKPSLDALGHEQVRIVEEDQDYVAALNAWDEEMRASMNIPEGIAVRVTNLQDDTANKGH